jgi:hypothetical protein
MGDKRREVLDRDCLGREKNVRSDEATWEGVGKE